MFPHSRTPRLPTPEQALPGRPEPAFTVPDATPSSATRCWAPCPGGLEIADFGLGCFWGAERKSWQPPAGVWTTLAGYRGGHAVSPVFSPCGVSRLAGGSATRPTSEEWDCCRCAGTP